MQLINTSDITIDNVSLPVFSEKEVRLDILRTDKIHPVVSGNKWFKLRFYLKRAAKFGKTTIVTKGGPWSNHIVATAAACKQNNFRSIGIIRGEKPPVLSSSMQEAMRYGMELIFISRKHFSENRLPGFITNCEVLFIDYGGYGVEGAKGAATILEYCKKESYTHILAAVGSGTMLAGLINASSPDAIVTGISSMKNNNSLETEIRKLLDEKNKPFGLIHEYHFGGFAKHTKELTDFMNNFFKQTNVPADIVYTSKLFYAITDLASKNYFPAGSNILAIHSGGLQGNASLNKGTLIF